MKNNIVRLDDIEIEEVANRRQEKIEKEKEDNQKRIREIKERIRTEDDGKNAWQLNLELDERNTLVSNEPVFAINYDNMRRYIEYCPKYANKFYFNDMREDMYTTVLKKSNASLGEIGAVENIVIDAVREDILYFFGKLPAANTVKTAISNICLINRYNPVVEALHSGKWDHKKRLETFFIDTLDADDKPVVREMTKKFFYAACKRAHEPGADWDNMIILTGDQSIGKSKIMKRFCSSLGLEEYFAPVSAVDSSKDSNQIIDVSWIVVWEELAKVMKQESGEIKSVISAGDGFYRNSYGKSARLHKRKNVFIGNTNEDIFLKDYTSEVERRYWIIPCRALGKNRTGEFWKEFDKKFNDNYYKQIAFEAMYYYENEKDYKYQVLSVEGRNELINMQQEHKTTADNDFSEILFEVLDNIPDQQYLDVTSNFLKSFKKTLDMIMNDETYVPLDKNFRIKNINAKHLKLALEMYMPQVAKGRKYLVNLLSSRFIYTRGAGNKLFFKRK